MLAKMSRCARRSRAQLSAFKFVAISSKCAVALNVALPVYAATRSRLLPGVPPLLRCHLTPDALRSGATAGGGGCCHGCRSSALQQALHPLSSRDSRMAGPGQLSSPAMEEAARSRNTAAVFRGLPDLRLAVMSEARPRLHRHAACGLVAHPPPLSLHTPQDARAAPGCAPW